MDGTGILIEGTGALPNGLVNQVNRTAPLPSPPGHRLSYSCRAVYVHDVKACCDALKLRLQATVEVPGISRSMHVAQI